MTDVPSSALTGGADPTGLVESSAGPSSDVPQADVLLDDAPSVDVPPVDVTPALDRTELAERADVPQFVVDLVIDAGLLTPLDDSIDGERFAPQDVDMLVAARTLVGEGVALEEMAALAMRHATNVENLIDDAIDLLKRGADTSAGRTALAAAVERLVPVATQLVVGHFERTLRSRAMARIGGLVSSAGAIVVSARRLSQRVDPLAVYAAASPTQQRSLWLRPDAQMGLAALGAVETINPVGDDRFTRASAARAVLAARIKQFAPEDAPAPVLVGGFSFAASATHVDPDAGDVMSGGVDVGDVGTGGADAGDVTTEATSATVGHRADHSRPAHGLAESSRLDIADTEPANSDHNSLAHGLAQNPAWEGFGDCMLVLPELTVLDRPDGTWALAATRVGPDGDEDAARVELEVRLSDFEQQGLFTSTSFESATAAATDEAAQAHLFLGSVREAEATPAATDEVAHVQPASTTAGLTDKLSEVNQGKINRDGNHDRGEVNRDGNYDRGEVNRDGNYDRGEVNRDGNHNQNENFNQDDDYEVLVASAVAAIKRGELHKVVLARMLTLDLKVNTVTALNLLRHRNPTCAVFAFGVGDSTFLGATPEELATLQGPRLNTTALAGTAPRGDSNSADERLASDLLESAKNRSEHRFVVDGITAALAGLGLVDPAPDAPDVLKLSTVQHLKTPIGATVQRRHTGASDMDVVRVAGVLHPTAATGGTPTDAALAFIADHEEFERGWYASPVGWCDLEGNGELGVALRSALVEPSCVHLFAGAGIVADSIPAEELAETNVKLQALLDLVFGEARASR